MSAKLQRVERTVQIVVAKPLAWALYACVMAFAGLVRATYRSLRSLPQTERPEANRDERSVHGKDHLDR